MSPTNLLCVKRVFWEKYLYDDHFALSVPQSAKRKPHLCAVILALRFLMKRSHWADEALVRHDGLSDRPTQQHRLQNQHLADEALVLPDSLLAEMF